MRKFPELKRVLARAIGTKRTQLRAQKAVERHFEDVQGIRILPSVIRELEGQGGEDIKGLIRRSDAAKARAIFLISGIESYSDVVGHGMPRLFNMTQGGIDVRSQIDQALRDMENEGVDEKVMEGLRSRRAREDFSDPVEKVEMSEYQKRIIKAVHDEYFAGEEMDVQAIVNANENDLLESVKLGGPNTALVVYAHSAKGMVSMTGRVVRNAEIPRPNEKLRAFIMHGCGGELEGTSEDQIMGQDLAENVHAPKRNIRPRELMRDIFSRRG